MSTNSFRKIILSILRKLHSCWLKRAKLFQVCRRHLHKTRIWMTMSVKWKRSSHATLRFTLTWHRSFPVLKLFSKMKKRPTKRWGGKLSIIIETQLNYLLYFKMLDNPHLSTPEKIFKLSRCYALAWMQELSLLSYRLLDLPKDFWRGVRSSAAVHDRIY